MTVRRAMKDTTVVSVVRVTSVLLPLSGETVSSVPPVTTTPTLLEIIVTLLPEIVSSVSS